MLKKPHVGKRQTTEYLLFRDMMLKRPNIENFRLFTTFIDSSQIKKSNSDMTLRYK